MFLGIDIGSVSVKIAILDEEKNIIHSDYRRHMGRPILTLISTLNELFKLAPPSEIRSATITGNGSKAVSRILDLHFINEITSTTLAAGTFLTQIKTLIDVGGHDSKLILLKPSPTGSLILADFSMNSLCAAGTGSFLDQQASRLGIPIEEFGSLAIKSKNPPRIAGRCSVFAKTDMIHLQQKATPVHDILAGLCHAMARNFKSTVGKGKKFDPLIAFVGGVAENSGMVKAFEKVLDLKPGELIVPPYHHLVGAIGAAIGAMNNGHNGKGVQIQIEALEDFMASQRDKANNKLEKLAHSKSKAPYGKSGFLMPTNGNKVKAYLGIDIGSLSTNVVVMDEEKNVLAKRYLMTAGRPLNAVCQGLREIGEELGNQVEIKGVCTTGSGRYLIGDFVGADVVKNEITAQARASIEIDKDVDTIFEIGGQDSKFIRLHNGAIIDFEMNKACAAGTGSYLEEQAQKLNINIKEEFGNLALNAECPAALGERCTVFMESDVVQNLGKGSSLDALAAGLSYSIAQNYINRVVQDKNVGKNIFFQGGVAFNKGVIAAFEKVTGKKITVPEHHEVTGAIGCCLLAQEHMGQNGNKSRFRGFDLSKRNYAVSSFSCKSCANHCEINRVTVENESPLYYGSRCEKYDVDKNEGKENHLPDLFAEREKMLEESYVPDLKVKKKCSKAPRIGIPRSLFFYQEFLPYFKAFFSELGCEVVLSDKTNKEIVHDGVESILAESCFPIKVTHGHILNLLKKKVDYIFLPSIINLKNPNPKMKESHTCPYVLAIPYMIKGALPLEQYGTRLIAPSIYFRRGKKHLQKVFREIGRNLGRKQRRILQAISKAEKAQSKFYKTIQKRGKEILENLPENTPAIVVVGRPYNICDFGINLEIPSVLRNLGALSIPMDFLPLDSIDLSDEWPNIYWRTGHRILAAAEIIQSSSRLNAAYITNFGCGPDSFLLRFFKQKMNGKPFLQIEVDEHSSDVGAITRCEAFLDSIENSRKKDLQSDNFAKPINISRPSLKGKKLYLPNMCDHAIPLGAAFTANGVPTEVMPEGDSETLYWGRKFTSGRECFPCLATTGEMVKITLRKDFDPKNSAFFMPTVGGGCRFSYYHKLQRNVLDELGFSEVPIYSPHMGTSWYRDLGIVGEKFIRQAFHGIVATDMLEKCKREIRPYEVEKGSTDKVYKESLEKLCRNILKTRDVIPILIEAREAFDQIKTNGVRPKPLIGVVGEIFARSNRFSNENVVRKIEEFGGEAWVSPVIEWFIYINYIRYRETLEERKFTDYILNWIIDTIQKRDLHRLEKPFKGLLRNFHEPKMSWIEDKAQPFLDRTFRGEGVLGIGKAADFIKKGASGIVNIMPFTCMPSTVVTSLIKRFREHYDGIPFISLSYDGLDHSNNEVRLEAFVHQCKEYMKSKT